MCDLRTAAAAPTRLLALALASALSVALTGCGGAERRDDPLFYADAPDQLPGYRGPAPAGVRPAPLRAGRPGAPPPHRGLRPRSHATSAGTDLAQRWRHGVLRRGEGWLPTLLPILHAAEAAATPQARAVLAAGRRLVIDEQRAFKGSCWTFADAVYAEGGLSRRQRYRVVSRSSKGPYVSTDRIQPGDFLSYINLSYRANPHSAIFVAWLDRGRNEALMLSYVGGRRLRPGGYRSYDLSRVYRVQRPRPPGDSLRRTPRRTRRRRSKRRRPQAARPAPRTAGVPGT